MSDTSKLLRVGSAGVLVLLPFRRSGLAPVEHVPS